MSKHKAGTRQTEDGHQDRLIAAWGLSGVLKHGRTLDQFEKAQPLSPLATELLYGSCRHYYSLAAHVGPLLSQPIRKKDLDVWALLIVGAYQLLHTRVPDHAAIAATVAASQALRQPWAKGLVNGCLRSLQRANREIAAPGNDLPDALDQQLQRIYGADYPALAAALLQRAPMALRVNVCQHSGAQYGAQLTAAGLAFRSGHAAETLILATPVPAATLPGYGTGAVSVQDAGAQLAIAALDQLLPQATDGPLRILDACAAPGGKLFHLIERLQGNGHQAQFTALEQSPPRLAHLQEEAARLGHALDSNLTLLQGDARNRDWWDGAEFDLILLDAPCTGSGTLRRHPDIKLLRDFSKLDDDIAVQNALLANLLPLLRPGAAMLYATCSILPAENDARIGRALKQAGPGRYRSVALDLPTGGSTERGWQLLPTDPDTDGFYYAGLVNLK
ncbi:MAG: transcription antitermination factor NusB [Pseudomonadales bacterium]